MSDVLPLQGPQKAECGCGCGLFGRLNAWGCVSIRCKCKRCQGKRNRQRGLAKQATARKKLGIGMKGQTNEEHWSDEMFANEVKSGRLADPAATAWLRIEAQVVANRATYGDRQRPTRAVLMPTGWGSEGLVMVRLSTWDQVVRPALEAAT